MWLHKTHVAEVTEYSTLMESPTLDCCSEVFHCDCVGGGWMKHQLESVVKSERSACDATRYLCVMI